MSAKSILLKVTPEVHAAIQEAAGRHQRSMQNVLVALIERWLAAGGPDPLQFDLVAPQAASGEVVDREARLAIEALVERVQLLQEQVISSSRSQGAQDLGWARKVVGHLDAGRDAREASGTPGIHFSRTEQQLLDGMVGRSPQGGMAPSPDSWMPMLSSFFAFRAEQQGKPIGQEAAAEEVPLDAPA